MPGAQLPHVAMDDERKREMIVKMEPARLMQLRKVRVEFMDACATRLPIHPPC
jgi:hypothetical protein